MYILTQFRCEGWGVFHKSFISKERTEAFSHDVAKESGTMGFEPCGPSQVMPSAIQGGLIPDPSDVVNYYCNIDNSIYFTVVEPGTGTKSRIYAEVQWNASGYRSEFDRVSLEAQRDSQQLKEWADLQLVTFVNPNFLGDGTGRNPYPFWMSASFPVITVDGPAASGKSTFAKLLARTIGYVFISSGITYRGLTWFLLDRKVPMENPQEIARVVKGLAFKTELTPEGFHFWIDDHDATLHTRDGSVNEFVSNVAAVPVVRKAMVAQLRALAQLAPLVMEGRDIGTVVFPESPYKFYLDADPALRAERRQAQGETDSIEKRDAIDSQRATGPLAKASDATLLDSGTSTLEALLEEALARLTKMGLKF